MAENFTPKSAPPDRVVRCFWHGPFSPYEALCLSSFVAAGIAVELFSEAPVSGLPAGVTRRNARDILDLSGGPQRLLQARHIERDNLDRHRLSRDPRWGTPQSSQFKTRSEPHSP